MANSSTRRSHKKRKSREREEKPVTKIPEEGPQCMIDHMAGEITWATSQARVKLLNTTKPTNNLILEQVLADFDSDIIPLEHWRRC